MITVGELLFGLAKSGSSENRRRSLNWCLTRLEVEAWETSAASAIGILRAKQEAQGKPLGPLDTQIAAHAVALRAVLVTRDRAFRHVPDLVGIEDRAADL